MDAKAFSKRMSEVPDWMWELNGAGDPSIIWLDHRPAKSKERAKHAIDAGFRTGTWVMRLTLPADLDEVSDDINPLLLGMGLSGATVRLEEKLAEAVALCRTRGYSWSKIGLALGVTRQSAWRRFGSSTD
jgi:hypothetical protein